MSPYQDIRGKNILTVLVASPSQEENLRRKAFFCPYTKNITLQYRGDVQAIFPDYDTNETPQFIVKPQRSEFNIQYSFIKTEAMGNNVNFWIQDQYFMDDVVRTYHCFNCQAPQLYFHEYKTVYFQSKQDVEAGSSFQCVNPFCKTNLTFLGIVKVKPLD